MESTVSVSKGVFVFPNGFTKNKVSKKKSAQPMFDKMFKKEIWYTSYRSNWEVIKNELKELHQRTYCALLNDVVDHVKHSYEVDEALMMEGVIPSATMLTGVSQPDHVSQFQALVNAIRDEVTPHIALVNSQDASTVKHLVENTVWQLINGQHSFDASYEDSPTKKTKLRKSLCTMRTLKNWYQSKYTNRTPKKKAKSNRSLVVIIPDFESFNCNVLQDFVMIISSYVPSLPIVLVFGVATSVSALHKSFPYHVSCKLLIKVFHTHSSPVYMNQVLEDVFLTHNSPFHLSGKAFELLTDVFLFYDFSVTGLIRSIKYCMMEHYYGDNTKALCCERDKLDEVIMNLNAEDLENIRKLMSFRPYLEKQDCRTKIRLFKDDGFFREVLFREMNGLHDYLQSFYLCLRLLAAFVRDLPRNVLGKSIRELYTKCTVENITDTPPFKETMQLLNFQSQIKLIETIKACLKIINTHLQAASPVKPLRTTPSKNNMDNMFVCKDLGENFAKTIRVHLLLFLRQIENANTEAGVDGNVGSDDEDTENTPGSRYKLKEKLLKATKSNRIESEFSMVRSRLISYLGQVSTAGLVPPRERPLHELLVFAAAGGVRRQLVGAPRGALHTALSNPTHYLQCTCCELPSTDSVVSSLPDVCLAYKLHRECGRHINLYDWLQAFTQVVTPQDTDELQEDPTLQLRFTRAVAELQFLGFIKSSKRKTDHVMRLTW